MMLKNKYTKADGETLAISALSFLSTETDRLIRFLDITGLAPATIRLAAENPQFLASIADYMLSNEEILIGFSQEQNMDPSMISYLFLKLVEAPPV